MSIIKNYQPAKGTCKVTFTYSLTPTSKVKSVQVLGDFNNWDAKKGPKMKVSKSVFSTDIELKSGQKYEFRYLLDGLTWDNDHNADSYVPSPFGGIHNSVIVLDAVKSETSAPAKAVVNKTIKSVAVKPIVTLSADVKKGIKAAAPKAAKVTTKVAVPAKVAAKVTTKVAAPAKVAAKVTPKVAAPAKVKTAAPKVVKTVTAKVVKTTAPLAGKPAAPKSVKTAIAKNVKTV